ncbi:helix-turn-helix transcriptional regulator [Nocardia niigatensis]|uniref:helix-turn-helix transcriptional regulator n=1 Tax=Nocardia niigatensis TaxID=209249 RepID=UPI0002D5F513|nr:hypothetical protein [Nocardia niigatensis]
MVSQNRKLTAPEIAEKYGRALSTVQRQWKVSPDWPESIGKRGRWLEYDEVAVDEVVRSWSGRPEFDAADRGALGGPDDLLTMQEIAAYTGLAYGTVRADVSLGKFGEPEPDAGRAKRFRRSTVDQAMRARRRYRKSE